MSVVITDALGDYGAVIVSGANLAIDSLCFLDDALWDDIGLPLLQNEVDPALNLAAARQARHRGISLSEYRTRTCSR